MARTYLSDFNVLSNVKSIEVATADKDFRRKSFTFSGDDLDVAQQTMNQLLSDMHTDKYTWVVIRTSYTDRPSTLNHYDRNGYGIWERTPGGLDEFPIKEARMATDLATVYSRNTAFREPDFTLTDDLVGVEISTLTINDEAALHTLFIAKGFEKAQARMNEFIRDLDARTFAAATITKLWSNGDQEMIYYSLGPNNTWQRLGSLMYRKPSPLAAA